MEIHQIESVVESLLFVAGERIQIDKLSDILQIDKKTLRLIMNNFIDKFNSSNRGVIIREIDNGYQMSTKPENYEIVKKLFEPKQSQGISQAAYETLAIVAYKGPVTRSKIEQIRGVNSDSTILKLVEKNLIRETGRLDSPGKPILYDITENFYRSFGFKSKSDLPLIEGNDFISG